MDGQHHIRRVSDLKRNLAAVFASVVDVADNARGIRKLCVPALT